MNSNNGWMTTNSEKEADDQESQKKTITINRRSTLQAIGAGGIIPFFSIKSAEATSHSTAPATEWSQLFDKNNGKERFDALVQAPDGGFTLVGSTEQVGAARDAALIVKTDENGIQEWNQTFGGTFSDERSFADIASVPCTGYAIVGERTYFDEDPPFRGEASPSNAWFLQTDYSGTSQVNKEYNEGVLSISPHSIVRESNGDFTVAGSLLDLIAGDIGDSGWLQKMDANGEQLWEKNYSGPGRFQESYFNAHVQSSDCGYVMAGETDYPPRGWLLKTDADGTEQWQQTFGTATEQTYTFADLARSTDGGYVLAGTTTPFYGYSDGWLVKVDANGSKEWEHTIFESGETSFSSITRTTDGGFVIAGTVDRPDRFSDGLVVKTDATGTVEWKQRFGAECEFAQLHAIIQTQDGGYAAAGMRRVCPGSWDGWILKLK
ncbi:hypothetical protein [Haladaptatus sp. W1]|uniref:hypothetical protein n=1 Tax=Haladaptatus sp. W1 TaxID=1897478 RepID=UPI001C2F8E49|nr:hypothetical protein [Haladaptatus sp. W1]